MADPIGQNQYGDDIYNTPNGAKTGTQITQELQAAGWDGQGDPVTVYNNTAAAGKSGPSAQTTNGGQQQQQQQQYNGYGPTPDQIAYYNAIAGYDYDALAQNQKQFEAQLAFQKDQMEKIGIPQVQIQQQLADMEDAHFKQQMALAQQAQDFQQAFQTGQLTGMYGGNPTEQAREFNAQNQLAQGQLGLNYLTQAAQFAASDPFALSDYLRGAQSNGQVPQFLQSLANSVNPGASMGPNQNVSQPGVMTLGSLANGLYNGATTNTDQALNAANQVFTNGANALPTGSLESLNPVDMNVLTSGITHSAGSQATPAFLQAYSANPIRQQQGSNGSLYSY